MAGIPKRILQAVRSNLTDEKFLPALGVGVFLTLTKWIHPYYIGLADDLDRFCPKVLFVLVVLVPWTWGLRLFLKWVFPLFVAYYSAYFLGYLSFFSVPLTLICLGGALLVLLLEYKPVNVFGPLFRILASFAVLTIPLWMADFDTVIARRVGLGTFLTLGMFLLSSHLRWVRARPVMLFLTFAIALAVPLFTMVKFMPQERLGKRLALQEHVTYLFSPKLDELPQAYHQLLDTGVDGRLFVMPHKKGRHITVIEADGRVGKLDVGDRVSDHSVVRDGVVYTAPGNVLTTIDARTLEVRRQVRLSPVSWRTPWHYYVTFLHMSRDGTRLFTSWDSGEYCVVTDLSTYENVAWLPQYLFGTCFSFDEDRRVLVTDLDLPFHEVSVYDGGSYELIRSKKFLGFGVHDAAFDSHGRHIITIELLTGRVTILDPETLEIVKSTRLRPGILWVEPDPKAPLIYVSNYFTGVVDALDTRTLDRVASVRLGRNLHLTSFGNHGRGIPRGSGKVGEKTPPAPGPGPVGVAGKPV